MLVVPENHESVIIDPKHVQAIPLDEWQVRNNEKAPGDIRYQALLGPWGTVGAGSGLRGWTGYQMANQTGEKYVPLSSFRFVGGTDTVDG